MTVISEGLLQGLMRRSLSETTPTDSNREILLVAPLVLILLGIACSLCRDCGQTPQPSASPPTVRRGASVLASYSSGGRDSDGDSSERGDGDADPEAAPAASNVDRTAPLLTRPGLGA